MRGREAPCTVLAGGLALGPSECGGTVRRLRGSDRQHRNGAQAHPADEKVGPRPGLCCAKSASTTPTPSG